jgi:hypothetical protein
LTAPMNGTFQRLKDRSSNWCSPQKLRSRQFAVA